MGSDRVARSSSKRSSLSFHFTLFRSVLPFILHFINRSLPLLCDSEIGTAVMAFIRAIHFLLSASRVPRAGQNVTIITLDAAHPNALLLTWKFFDSTYILQGEKATLQK